MPTTLPLGIRVAAGLLATTIDRLGKLPAELPTIAVSMAGQAVRTSMRIRQEITELAIRGDDVLSGLTGRPEEHPAWATFDEDEGLGTPTATATPDVDDAGPAGTSAARTGSAPTGSADLGHAPGTAQSGPAIATPYRANPALETQPPPPASAIPTVRPVRGRRAAVRTQGPAEPLDSPTDTAPLTADHELSVADLKERLQTLDVQAVSSLLAQEEAGPNRAPYLTLLENRLTTLQHDR